MHVEHQQIGINIAEYLSINYQISQEFICTSRTMDVCCQSIPMDTVYYMMVSLTTDCQEMVAMDTDCQHNTISMDIQCMTILSFH